MTPCLPSLPAENFLHEAAHAEVAEALGLTVARESAWEVDVNPPLTPRQRAMVALAGAIATGHENPQGKHGDVEQLRRSGLTGRALEMARDEVRGIVAARWGAIVERARRIEAKGTP